MCKSASATDNLAFLGSKIYVNSRGLLKELVKNCDGELKVEVAHLAAEYEHRLNRGNKAIYHLEAFVAKFMAIYMRFVEEAMGGI